LIYQVAAGADDGYVDSADDIFASAAYGLVGDDPSTASYYHSWFRFIDVTDVGGQTIASAVLSLWGYAADTGTPQTTVSFATSSDPFNPSDFFDYTARFKTSAVSWNSPGLSTGGFTNSPDLSTALQEVADDYTPVKLLVFHQNNGSTDAYSKPYTYDGDTARAAKLTIDNGGGGGLVQRGRPKRPIYQR
jgi:hypothetical protein